jgi:hypothetical protein
VHEVFRVFSFIFIFFGLLGSFSVSANGRDQRVVDGKYLINLSRAPFTPSIKVDKFCEYERVFPIPKICKILFGGLY